MLMKKSLLTLILPLLILQFNSGCSSILPGNEALVVRAEQARQSAFDTFDAFTHAERNFELGQLDPTEYRKSPVHLAAEKVRNESISWVISLDVVIKRYKSARDPANRQALNEALATLRVALAEAEKYLVQLIAENNKKKGVR